MSRPAELLPNLYRTERSYGWSIGMRRITHALMTRVSLPPGPILEVGCGGGAFLDEIACKCSKRLVIGIDLHPVALLYSVQAPHLMRRVAQANLMQLPFDKGSIGTLMALDAFDQQGIELQTALSECWRVLQPGGLLILRVSAHEWLASTHDIAFNTGRRYQLADIRYALHEANFESLHLTYANLFLLLPVGLQRLLQRRRILDFRASLYMAPIADRWVRRILAIEAYWLRRYNFPSGISLYAIALKRVTSHQSPAASNH